MAAGPVVIAEDLTQRYGAVTALDRISIRIPPGRMSACWARTGLANRPCWT